MIFPCLVTMKKAKEKEEKHVRDFPSFILKKM